MPEAARQVEAAQIPRPQSGGVQQDFNARADRRLGLQQQRDVHLADAQGARAVILAQAQGPPAIVGEAVLGRQAFPGGGNESSRCAASKPPQRAVARKST